MKISSIKNKPIILTDIDGVVLDWVGALKIFLQHSGIKTATPDPTEWHLDKWILAPNPNKVIDNFNKTAMFGKLRPFVDAKYMIPKLSNSFTFVGITSCSSDEETVVRRFNNIEDIFPGIFYNIHFLDLGDSKTDALNEYAPTIWVEDNTSNALAGAHSGHECFLINRSYNVNDKPDGVKKIDSWHDIYLELNKREK